MAQTTPYNQTLTLNKTRPSPLTDTNKENEMPENKRKLKASLKVSQKLNK